MFYVVYFTGESGIVNDDTVAYTENTTVLKRYIEFIRSANDAQPMVIQCVDETEVKSTFHTKFGIEFDDVTNPVEDYELELYRSRTRNKCAIMTPNYERKLREWMDYNEEFNPYLLAQTLTKLEELLRRYYKDSNNDVIAAVKRMCDYLAAYDYIEHNFDSVMGGVTNSSEIVEEILHISNLLNLDLADIVESDDGLGVIDYYEYIDGFVEPIFLVTGGM